MTVVALAKRQSRVCLCVCVCSGFGSRVCQTNLNFYVLVLFLLLAGLSSCLVALSPALAGCWRVYLDHMRARTVCESVCLNCCILIVSREPANVSQSRVRVAAYSRTIVSLCANKVCSDRHRRRCHRRSLGYPRGIRNNVTSACARCEFAIPTRTHTRYV